jgi:hypothetical protein
MEESGQVNTSAALVLYKQTEFNVNSAAVEKIKYDKQTKRK